MSSMNSRDDSEGENHEMVNMGDRRNPDTSLNRSHSHSPLLQMQGLGEPSSKTPITWIDAASVLLTLAAFAIAVVVIWNQYAAVQLGQINQLVVVGFALSVMNLGVQRQVQLAAIFAELQYGRSKLTNFDGLLRKSILSQRLDTTPRLILLVLIVVPLSLSAAYKQFSGGHSTRTASFGRPSNWGFISRPGWPWTGNGLSGAVDAYVPFWNDVGTGRTYGYNMLVASNTTAALLDTPEQDLIYAEQSGLRRGEYVTLNTTVNATVAQFTEIRPSDRVNAAYWENLWTKRGFINTTIDMSFDYLSQLSAPRSSNFSEIYLAIWNQTNESFQSTAQLFTQTRRYCQGTWNISAGNVTLLRAQLLEQTEDQTVVQELALDMGKWFTELLPEYNYRWYPPNNPMDINTFPPLVASMLWARVISKNGNQNTNRADKIPAHAARTYYQKAPQEIQKTNTVVTLKRSNWLLLLLAINPVIVILTVCFKGVLYSIPVSNGFGLVSLLSGLDENCPKLLHGASLSGTLRDDVYMRFEVVNGEDTDQTARGRIQVFLEKVAAPDRNGKVQRRIVYG